MRALTTHKGLCVPLDRSNIDTDAIIPKQFLKSIKRSGFGVNLFDAWRYLDPGELGQDVSIRQLNPDFILNQPRYAEASILLARDNFGCGSSREHAPWALEDYGFRSIIASSFADIFYNNCFKNGILPIVLDAEKVDQLFKEVVETKGYYLAINLAAQTVTTPTDEKFDFSIDRFRKHCLLHGLDDIDLTLQQIDAIKSFEKKHSAASPWLFTS